MKPASFTYHRVRDVQSATALMSDLGEDAKFLAGGQSLIAMMAFRLARPSHLVDIGRVRELAYVRRDGDSLAIGALTTHHHVESAAHAQLEAGFEVLRDAMTWVGHLPIRTRGTVGGSIAHADATAEWGLLAVLLDAVVVAYGPGGQRVVPAREFFGGYYTNALAFDEMVVELRFPAPAPHAAMCEFAQRRGDFAIVSAAVALDLDGSRVLAGRVALGGVAPAPVRVDAAEAVLARGGRIGAPLFAEVARAAVEAIDPPADAHGSARYRRELTRNLVAQACARAAAA